MPTAWDVSPPCEGARDDGRSDPLSLLSGAGGDAEVGGGRGPMWAGRWSLRETKRKELNGGRSSREY